MSWSCQHFFCWCINVHTFYFLKRDEVQLVVRSLFNEKTFAFQKKKTKKDWLPTLKAHLFNKDLNFYSLSSAVDWWPMDLLPHSDRQMSITHLRQTQGLSKYYCNVKKAHAHAVLESVVKHHGCVVQSVSLNTHCAFAQSSCLSVQSCMAKCRRSATAGLICTRYTLRELSKKRKEKRQ